MSNYALFSVMGIEIEYMLVDRNTLAVQPVSDALLTAFAGTLTNETVLGDIAVSNELVLHVIELKNNGPKPLNAPFIAQFQHALDELQPWLKHHNLTLLPTAAHPFMNPLTDTQCWPHGNRDIYQQYDKIFNCKGHGWSNLQSMHINLPYQGDTEFSLLHNAIRLLLPLIPALSASSPLLDGKPTGWLDTRLCFYADNQARIPEITGRVIPDPVTSRSHYQDTVLTPMYQAIRPFDTQGILQKEWLNSRGVIPKFNYDALEIRIVDTQECVTADLSIAQTITALLQHWIEGSHFWQDMPCETERLHAVYQSILKTGFATLIEDSQLKKQWQIPARLRTARDVWSYWIEQISSALDTQTQLTLETLLRHGNLSERLLRACNADYRHETLHRVYSNMAECLLTNRVFMPDCF